MAEQTIDVNDPVMTQALVLAHAFLLHCRENDLPRDFVIGGVAVDAKSLVYDYKKIGFVQI